MGSPLGICGAQLAIALTFYLQRLPALLKPWEWPCLQSGQGDKPGCRCLVLLVLMGDLAREVRNELLCGKTPSIRGKTGAQTHGFPQPPRGDLFKGTLKDLSVFQERYEGNRADRTP